MDAFFVQKGVSIIGLDADVVLAAAQHHAVGAVYGLTGWPILMAQTSITKLGLNSLLQASSGELETGP